MPPKWKKREMHNKYRDKPQYWRENGRKITKAARRHAKASFLLLYHTKRQRRYAFRINRSLKTPQGWHLIPVWLDEKCDYHERAIEKACRRLETEDGMTKKERKAADAELKRLREWWASDEYKELVKQDTDELKVEQAP